MDIMVLVAEDDDPMRRLMVDILRKEGYNALEAKDGEEAIDLFFSNLSIDLVILDIMMPKLDGWQVLNEIRKHSNVPILMITALNDLKHEIEGFRKGADEYIGKPFSYEKLLARINAMLRRVIFEKNETIHVGNLTLEAKSQKVFIHDQEIKLSSKEYHLLLFFSRHPNQVFHRDQLIYNIWGYDYDGDSRTIDTHIKTLRAKLGDMGGLISTVRGSGYQFLIPKVG